MMTRQMTDSDQNAIAFNPVTQALKTDKEATTTELNDLEKK
jgi:hypothetical protein